jgi:FtsP/CotA-like multicopper oxidase with cupredoxin domain
VFLSDIKPSDVVTHRDLVFQDKKGLRINGEQFRDGHIDQKMLLNAVEEWTVSNMDNDKEHPFHIHINPFQIFEVFSPQGADAQSTGACPANPTDPATWKPYGKCAGPKKDFVWWDTFAIPASRQDTVTQACSALTNVPDRFKAQGSTAASCVVTIPGYFKMRSQFVDFTGQYVLHCHILTHEDRGMMQLVEVVPDTTIYTHH